MATVNFVRECPDDDPDDDSHDVGETRSVAARMRKNGAVSEVKHRKYIIPANLAGGISSTQIMEAVQKSLGAAQNIISETKDIMRGVECRVRAIDTVILNEKPDGERTITIQRKFDFVKDR